MSAKRDLKDRNFCGQKCHHIARGAREPRVHIHVHVNARGEYEHPPVNRTVRTIHDPRCGQYRAFLEINTSPPWEYVHPVRQPTSGFGTPHEPTGIRHPFAPFFLEEQFYVLRRS